MLYLCGGICIIVWILSIITNEYSWVDRLWPILPGLYSLMFVYKKENFRANLIACLICLWSVRLSYNFYRKGGFRIYEGEDYRWKILKYDVINNKYVWFIFNLIFISVYQNILLYLLALPVYVCAHEQQNHLLVSHYIIACFFTAFLAIETIADQQQWNFQQRKKMKRDPQNLTFIKTGLFKYSRHPNFLAEQSIWWSVGLYCMPPLFQKNEEETSSQLWDDNTFINIVSPTLACLLGPLLLTLLFMGSTRFTESISVSKYHTEYQEYQNQVPMWIPRFL